MADTPNTAEPGKPRRRWLQFRLRTLLVGVVLLSLPCAYFARREARIVAARKNWLDSHRREMDRCTLMAAHGVLWWPKGRLPEEDQQLYQTPSRIRLWLGDVACVKIAVRRSASTAEQIEAESLFPEAFIIVVDPPP